jgi:hypothetical protein
MILSMMLSLVAAVAAPEQYETAKIALEGEATVVTGGELVGGKETAPGETRGPEVRGVIKLTDKKSP